MFVDAAGTIPRSESTKDYATEVNLFKAANRISGLVTSLVIVYVAVYLDYIGSICSRRRRLLLI